MGNQWLKEIVLLLKAAGIPAGAGYPPGERAAIRECVAAVCIHGADQEKGSVEFEIRLLGPRNLGLWQVQDTAVRVMELCSGYGMVCRMGQMTYESGSDCYCVTVIAGRAGLVGASGLKVFLGEESLGCVTEFSAEQNQGRRLVGTVNQAQPVVVSPGTGGWQFRLVRIAPAGTVCTEPEEPFILTVEHHGGRTIYAGCALNRVETVHTRGETRIGWEGFALTREVVTDGEAAI